MNASPLPRLTVSREEAKEKIQARITQAPRISGSQCTYADLARACKKWSEYNEALLVSLFGSNINYRTFTGFTMRSPISSKLARLLRTYQTNKIYPTLGTGGL